MWDTGQLFPLSKRKFFLWRKKICEARGRSRTCGPIDQFDGTQVITSRVEPTLALIWLYNGDMFVYCEQISWSKAESQQIAVRWLLYWLRHLDREQSRLQLIWHLHAAWGEYRSGPPPTLLGGTEKTSYCGLTWPLPAISLPPDAGVRKVSSHIRAGFWLRGVQP